MLVSIRNAHAEGIKILAECGGFLYLQEHLEDEMGNCWPMAGPVSYTHLDVYKRQDVEPEESTNYYRDEQDVHYVPKRKLKDIVFTAEKK